MPLIVVYHCLAFFLAVNDPDDTLYPTAWGTGTHVYPHAGGALGQRSMLNLAERDVPNVSANVPGYWRICNPLCLALSYT